MDAFLQVAMRGFNCSVFVPLATIIAGWLHAVMVTKLLIALGDILSGIFV